MEKATVFGGERDICIHLVLFELVHLTKRARAELEPLRLSISDGEQRLDQQNEGVGSTRKANLVRLCSLSHIVASDSKTAIAFALHGPHHTGAAKTAERQY